MRLLCLSGSKDVVGLSRTHTSPRSRLHSDSLLLALGLTALTVVAMIVAFFGIQSTVIRSLEVEYAREYQELYSGFLARQGQELLGTTADWSFWGETYDYARGTHPEYLVWNLHEESMGYLEVDYVVITNNDGYTLFEQAYCDVCTVDTILTSDPEWESFVRSVMEQQRGQDRYFATDQGLLLVAAQPILPSIGQAEPAGVLAFGRMVRTTLLARLSTPEKVSVGVVETTAVYPDGLYWDTDHIVAQVPLLGSDEDFLGFLELSVPRYISQTVRHAAFWALLAFGGFLIILIFLVLSKARRQLIDPVVRLTEEMKRIGQEDNATVRVSVPDHLAEITSLAQECNRMLEQLERSQKTTAKRAAYLRYITENIHDIIVELDHDFVVRWVTSSIDDELGYAHKQVVGRPVPPLIHPDDRQDAFHWLRMLKSFGKSALLELRIRSASGEYLWMEMTGQALETGIVLSARNIEQRKRDRDRIAFLSFFDDTTELYNRAYLEKQIHLIDSQDIVPTSVLMVDVNGLKLANDTFGHEEGDNLLRRVASLLKEAMGPMAILGRWGGDEFVALMPNTSREERDRIRTRILELCQGAVADPIQPSVSVGDATRKRQGQRLPQVIRKAEERMYRHKLTESRSARSAIIAALQTSLSEKTMETKDHGQRMQYLADLLGRRIGMSGSELEELALAVMLHDIGKVAIPAQILEKPGKLTEREWQIMQSHTEVGYRIAAASLELAFVAEFILYHHERWDGTGYPEHRKETDIPLVSRVISLVDAYDVMVHERPYAAARSHEEAIAELKRCSGSQFDPQLTDMFVEILEEWDGQVPENVKALDTNPLDRRRDQERKKRSE